MEKNIHFIDSKYLAQMVLLALLYLILGKISFSLTITHNNITNVILAAEGVTLAFVILYGARVLRLHCLKNNKKFLLLITLSNSGLLYYTNRKSVINNTLLHFLFARS